MKPIIFLISTLALSIAIACSSTPERKPFVAIDPNAANEGGAVFGDGDAGAGHTCAVNNVSQELDKDFDGDGFPLKDDCNECDTKINKGAFDVEGNGLDEDCNGTVDDPADECDDNLPMDPSDPFVAAQAMGLCRKATKGGKEWGVVSARYTRPDGLSASPDLDVGVLTAFGVNAPQAGKSMLALSSGYARAPGDPGFQPGTGRAKNSRHGAPPGYPKEFAGCPPTVVTGLPQDGIGLEVVVRAPSNARAIRYQQNFFTYEYSTYICTRWNDFFVTIMDPAPAGLADGNIAFDSLNNPISVNNGLLQVCAPGTYAGKTFDCPLGTNTLAQTGFESHAATGWLTTSAPVEPGSEITLRFTIWDSGDGAFDSTVLLDDFAFTVEPANGTQTAPSIPR